MAASAATDAPDIEAFGKMTIYRTARDAKRHHHHEPHGGGGGGGGGGYTAPAVHLATTSLHIANLVATNNALYSVVGWMKLSFAAVDEGNNIFTTDPEGNYGPGFGLNSGVSKYQVQLGVNNSDYSAAETMNSDVSDPDFPYDQWACVMMSIDATTLEKGKIYYGDTDVTDATWSTFGSAPITIASNGLPFWFGDDSYGDFVEGDFADWRIMPGISLLDGGGDIPLATRRLFIDGNGKPVDPAVATASLGAPAILFSGNALTFGTNQGTGGAAILAGSLTNASTSPSD